MFNVISIFDSGADKYRHNASTNRYEFIMQYARSAYGVSVIVEAPEETRSNAKTNLHRPIYVVLTSRLYN